ncbi:hypothetical protein OPIT5_27375 [Opitutaceae bacterium TAV5]|nr:hypothetical protein OPIT5_27375 [Opitutaceae bacterium TAV5]
MNTIRKHKKLTGLTTTVAYAALALSTFPGSLVAAPALPSGGQVTAGQATIHPTGASSLQVSQSSRAAIIQWGDFSIGQGGAVHFANGSGATLNRVTGSLPSRIDGSLTATGSVYLVNRAGIVVGSEGRIDTGGSFVASTHDVADAAFLAGGDLTFAGTGDALVVNAGRIGSLGGDVALIARRVENTGAITAPQGTVALAAGYEVLARDHALSDGKFLVRIGGSDTVALNAGAIEAAAAELKANGGNVYALAGNTTGIVRATGIDLSGGRIIFDAGNTGSVELAGQIAAVGASLATPANAEPGDEPQAAGFASKAPTPGGTITATGATITVRSGATLDASGTTGGTILLGGDYQGGKNSASNFADQALATAATTTVEADARLLADGSVGDGGRIVVWADDLTTYAGHLSAQALGATGDGGFAEVSGKRLLAFNGTADLNAAHGATGTLLLDPYDITISNDPGNHGTIGGDGTYTATDTSVLNVNTLLTALANANVTVTTSGAGSDAGNITVADALTWTSTRTLSLMADNNIYINAPITAVNGGLTLSARGTAVTTGSGNSIRTTIPEGSILTSDNGHIDVGTFILNKGTWLQNSANLTLFMARDFRILGAGATEADAAFFLRYAGGTGANAANAYQIVDIYGLQGVGGGLNNGAINRAMLGTNRHSNTQIVYYSLAANIDAAITASWNPSGEEAFSGFIPIGWDTTFYGNFDGRGHAVSNLYIDRVGTGTQHVGLFGSAGAGAVGSGNSLGLINNLGLINAYVRNSGGGLSFTGGIVGSYGSSTSRTLTNLWSINSTVIGSGNATGGLFGSLGVGLQYSSADGGSVQGANIVGGIAGQLAGTTTGSIRISFSSASVTGSGDYVGGLVGSNAGQISNSYATGAVTGNDFVGGLVGDNTNATGVTSSYSTGLVTAVQGSFHVGGFMGGTPNTTSTTAGNGNYWDIETSGRTNGTTNRATASTTDVPTAATGISSDQLKDPENFATWGWRADLWAAPDGTHAPELWGVNVVRVTPDDVISIYGDDPNAALTAAYDFGTNTALTSASVNTPATLVTPATSSSDVGTYDITVNTANPVVANGRTMRVISGGNGTLTITPGSIVKDVIYDFTGNTVTGWIYGSDNKGGITWTLKDGDTLLTEGEHKVKGVLGLKNASDEVITWASLLNAGDYKLFISGLEGDNAGDYRIADTGHMPGSLTVSQAPLTLKANDGLTKVYGNAFTSEGLLGEHFSITGGQLYGTDTVTGVTLTSDGAAVTAGVNGGTPYTITAANAQGMGLSNYEITYTPGALTVTPATLTITANNLTKDFGQTFTFNGTEFTVTGLKNDDEVTLTTLASDGAAAGAAIDTWDIVISNAIGTGLDNYTIDYVPGTLTVSPALIDVTYAFGSPYTWSYGDTPGTIDWTLDGLLGGDADTVTGVLAVKNSGGATVTLDALLNAGAYTLTIGSLTGENHENYRIAATGNTPGSLVITPRVLTIATQGTIVDTRVYDGTTAIAVLSHGLLANVVNGDSVALALTAAYGDRNVGEGKAVTGSYALANNDAGNYVLAEGIAFSGTAAITPATLTVGTQGTVAGKVYDGTTAATVATHGVLAGLFGDDEVTLTLGGLAFADKNAGTGKTVTGAYTISGDDAGNYTFTGNAFTGTATITPKQLTVGAAGTVAADKVYDGLLAIGVLTHGELSGVVTGDTVTLSLGNTQFADKNVGNGKTVTGLYALGGTDVGNYTLASTAFTGTSSITPASLTIGTQGTLAGTKIYDGTTAIEILTHGAVAGLIGNDSVSLALAAAYADKNVGAAKDVTGTYTLGGADAGNYTLADATFAATAAIEKAVLTYIANPATRAEGTANPAFTGMVTGFVADETLASATTGSLVFTSPAGELSAPGSYAIIGSGLEAQNYVFVQATGNATALTVTPETTADEILAEFLRDNPVHYETPAGTDTQPALEKLLEQFSGEEKQEPAPGSLTGGQEDEQDIHPDNRDLGPWLRIASLK